MRRFGLLAGVAAVLAAGPAACGTTSGQGQSRQPPPVAGRATGLAGARPAPATLLTVGSRPTGPPIAPGFLGLSFEFPAVETYAGSDPGKPNPVFEQLVRNLAPSAAPAIRIGGDSTDLTWWPLAHVQRPAGARYALTSRWLNVTRNLVADLGARLMLGIDLEANSPKVAGSEARTLVSSLGAGRVDALELGNEPELYGSFLWDGSGKTGRPRGYDFATFLGDFSRVATVLSRVPLAGPSVGGPLWLPHLKRFLAAEPRVRIMTLHRYPLKLCFVSPGAPEYPTIGNLLSARSSRGLAESVAPYVRMAHARGRRLRVDEMNVNSCGHDPNVSNSFASALWGLDVLFEMARVGVDGVNFHTYPGASYELFRFRRAHGRWEGYVAPEYYGLLMFAQAVQPGSRLLGVRELPRPGSIKGWAVRSPSGQTEVVAINDGTRAQNIAVRTPRNGAVASLEWLRAPNLGTGHGVSIGGTSFAPGTTTGRFTSAPKTTLIKPVHNEYTAVLPPASAALLMIP